jgi:hypothetical protein
MGIDKATLTIPLLLPYLLHCTRSTITWPMQRPCIRTILAAEWEMDAAVQP